MTTYLLNCPAGEDPSDCGLAPNGYTIIEDSSSMIGGFSYETEYVSTQIAPCASLTPRRTVSQSCKLQGTTHANCLWTIYSDGTTTSTSVDFDVASLPFGGFMPVHVTATQTDGVSASTAASVSASTATSTGTSTGSAVTSTSTASGSNTATATASRTESTNAAMPKMTGNARWVAGGAAAALALAVV